MSAYSLFFFARITIASFMDERRIRARVRAHLAHTYPQGVPKTAELRLEGALSERAGGDFFDGYYAARTGSMGRPVYSKLRSDGTFFSDSGAEISWEDGEWAMRSKSGVVTEDCCEYYSDAISKWLARVPPTNGWEGDGISVLSITHLEFDWLNLEPVRKIGSVRNGSFEAEKQWQNGDERVRIDALSLG